MTKSRQGRLLIILLENLLKFAIIPSDYALLLKKLGIAKQAT